MLIEFLLDLANNSNHKTYFSFLSGLKLQSLYNDCKKRGGKGRGIWNKSNILYLLYLQDKGELILTYKINGYFVCDSSNIIYKKEYLIKNLKNTNLEILTPVRDWLFQELKINNFLEKNQEKIINFINKKIRKGIEIFLQEGYTTNSFLKSFNKVIFFSAKSEDLPLYSTTNIINLLKQKEISKKLSTSDNSKNRKVAKEFMTDNNKNKTLFLLS